MSEATIRERIEFRAPSAQPEVTGWWYGIYTATKPHPDAQPEPMLIFKQAGRLVVKHGDYIRPLDKITWYGPVAIINKSTTLG